MTIAFVHGNPETSAIWQPLLAELGRDDIVTLSPPGFGAPIPIMFGATADDYASWLVDELYALGAHNDPVHLVGHDWGGGHVARVVADRPDLVRSWVIDIAGALDPEYEWHDLAQIWQSDAGEEAVDAASALQPEELTESFIGLGMTEEAARSTAEAWPDMAKVVLPLYRSARQPAMADLGHRLESTEHRPSLAIIAAEDPYVGGDELPRRTAERLGSEIAELAGVGHWWMLQDPAAGAKALQEFWAGLDA